MNDGTEVLCERLIMMNTQTLYKCLVLEELESEAFFQIYWARGRHLGEAIDRILEAARGNGLRNPEPTQADPCELEGVEAEVFPNTQSDVFWSESRFCFPVDPSFSFPVGILASGVEPDDDDGFDADEIVAGYQISKRERGLIEIGVNVMRQDLLPLYERLLMVRRSYRVFWYLLHNHWNGEPEKFLRNEQLDSPEKILTHLRDHMHNSVMNGFVTLTSYLEEGATNLSISEHKRIVILTYSEEMESVYVRSIEDFGFGVNDALISFDNKIHHWHYRPKQSLDGAALERHLCGIGFSIWDRRQ